MAIVIDATIGGAASNSYLTLMRATDLWAETPHADDFLSDFSINRRQLLVQATRLIDRHLSFIGSKATTGQALAWPRSGVSDQSTGVAISSSVIPLFVELATAEWAVILQNESAHENAIAPGLTRLRTPSYEMEFGGSGKRTIPSVVADLLFSYGAPALTRMVRLIRA